MSTERRARLAISFADLALLLLGFFVLLQASGSQRRAVLEGVGSQFGGKAAAAAPDIAQWPASDLFVAGEAMLSPAGNARISAYVRSFAAHGEGVELRSVGQDRANGRYDAWDLAAARTGAVARALEAAGLRRDRILIRGLDEGDGTAKGQAIRLAPTQPKAG
ncbi:MAG: flagellar motor protein [Sphingobium sp.]|nr:MAG: flagellar motor protein [Sphingobium sp.]